MRWILATLMLAGCPLGDDKDDTNPDSPARTCADVQSDFAAEAESIRSCTDAVECGQELTGTSCGCTRNWVARTDADTTAFYALIDEAQSMECDLGLGSTCDCPDTGGFDCVDNTCTWLYTR